MFLAGETLLELTPFWGITLQLYNQLITNPPYIHNPDAFVFRKFVTKLGDENMQASGIEEAVIAPKFKKNALGADYFVAMLTQSAEDFRFTMRKFL